MTAAKVRIPVCAPDLGAGEEEAVRQAVRSGFISSKGPFVGRFEEGFARYIGVGHGVAVSSGTAALHLAMVALGIGPGDEVIVPDLTMIAVANSVTYTGARPVPVDAERETWNLDPDLVEAAVTPRTRAIIAVHTYGHPVRMDRLMEVARDRRLRVVEDAAEAIGSEYRGVRVGGLGDLGCFSFYANKVITTGEGGMVVANDASLAARVRSLADQGFGARERFRHEVVGFNYRLTNLQAALGFAQLERVEELVEARRRNASRYEGQLADIADLVRPPQAAWAKNVYWMYSVLLRAERRSEIARRLLEEFGIETRPFFVPISEQPVYHGLPPGGPTPIAAELSRRGLNLPSGSGLRAEEIQYVAAALETTLSGG